MRIGYKRLAVFTSLIAFLSLLQITMFCFAETFPGGQGGP